jgi:hypothetical protein
MTTQKGVGALFFLVLSTLIRLVDLSQESEFNLKK